MEIKFTQRVYCAGKFQMFYQKAAVMGTLVLESGFFRFYAPLRIPSKRKRAVVGKILELPEPHNFVHFLIFKYALGNKKDLDYQCKVMLYLFGDVTGLFFMSWFYGIYTK